MRSTRILALFALLSLSLTVSAQDTLRVMVYNLLFYGASSPGGCTLTPIATKNGFFSTIFNAARPDILGINEMGPNTLYASNLLVNVLDPINPDYERTTYMNPSGSGIVNHLFYNSAKLGLADEGTINNSFRDAHHYKLFYKDPGLAVGGDTTFIHVVVVHLDAAGAGSSTAVGQATDIMDFYDALGQPGNYIVMGDMNSDASTDAGMEVFTAHSNPDIRMYDPVNKPGTWNNNSGFSAYHTQSTRVSSSDCGSAGGLDDRFDHIMVNRFIMNDSARVKYIPGSYWAYGQDGAHFNNNVNGPSPPNSSVSAAVANALVAGSDHLPVILDLEISLLPTSLAEATKPIGIAVANVPVTETLEFTVTGPAYQWELLDLAGRNVMSGKCEGTASVEASQLAPGVYVLRVRQGISQGAVKLMKI